MKPFISIIIRTKNEERWLGDLLKRLTEQTFKNFEVIGVDSGSTDRTLAIYQQYSDSLDLKVEHIPPESFNYSYACNVGANMARGEIVGYLSGHCLPIWSDYLAIGLKHFDDPLVAGVYGSVLHLPDATFIEKVWYTAGLGTFIAKKLIAGSKPVVLTSPRLGLLGNTNSLIRRSLWQKYPFQERMKDGGEDTEWAVHFQRLGYTIVKVPRMAVYHSHGFGWSRFMKQRRHWRECYKKALQ